MHQTRALLPSDVFRESGLFASMLPPKLLLRDQILPIRQSGGGIVNTLQISIVAERPPAAGAKIREPYDAAAVLAPIADLSQEVFVVIALNGANQPIGDPRIVTMGLLDSNQVHPREVFAPAIVARASSIIIAHNHPSGTLDASPEDIAITGRLVRAGKLLGIPVLDHIILAQGGKHISMKARGGAIGSTPRSQNRI